jgi:hypothetical protein
MKNRKNTFWSLLQRGRIVIPQIQRDYAYGRNTSKAMNVRDELLKAMLNALKDEELDYKNTLILDFVYGSVLKDNSMTPIDGQQRLTTLYLLHLYAAIKEKKDEKTDLLKFSYETRHSANEFCKSLINDFVYDLNSNISLKEQIQNQAKYLNSFDDDPTIQSILVVLQDIHERFFEIDNLWDKLTLQERIIFYYLDLEKFGLTDDLYIKMNSRGKSLTQYEIFKSSFEKFLEEKHPQYKEILSKSLDVEWTNMLWAEDCEIDTGFLNLFKNIFTISYYLKNSKPRKIEDADKCFEEMLSSEDDLKFYIDSLNAFQKLYRKDTKGISDYYNRFFYSSDETLGKNGLIRVFWQSKDNLFIRATSQSLTWAETIMFYALIISLQNELDEKLLFFRFRQLRNLITNSGFELRPENIHKMLSYTKELMLNGILPEDTFNNNQLLEEKCNYKTTDIDNNLLVFENHDILRGSLSLFTNDNNICIDTLNKFLAIFDNNHKANTPLIRQALLSTGDYSQQDTDSQKRFLVHRSDVWRNFFTVNQRRKSQDKIIEIIDRIALNGDLKNDLQAVINYFLLSVNKNWRYYFVKYDNHCHNQWTQGYYYWKNIDDRPMEVIMLNSSYESASNLEWNIFNKILNNNNREITTLDDHGASSLIVFAAGISMNGVQSGFMIEPISDDNQIFKILIERTVISKEGLYPVLENEDYVEKGQGLIKMINEIREITYAL